MVETVLPYTIYEAFNFLSTPTHGVKHAFNAYTCKYAYKAYCSSNGTVLLLNKLNIRYLLN